MPVVGPVIVGMGPINLPANAATMELLWYCGRAKTAAPPPPAAERAILMRWLGEEGGGGGTQTDRRG